MSNSTENQANTASDDLARVQLLLPWYAKNALTGDDQIFMQHWLAEHLDQHPEVHAELAWLKQSSTQLTQVDEATRPAEDAGLADLLKRITLEAPPAQQHSIITPSDMNTLSIRERIMGWIESLVHLRSPALAFGVALLLIQTGVISALLLKQPADQMPLNGSNTPPSLQTDQTTLIIAFNPNATELAIRQVLIKAHAQIIAGPSALGLYTC